MQRDGCNICLGRNLPSAPMLEGPAIFSLFGSQVSPIAGSDLSVSLVASKSSGVHFWLAKNMWEQRNVGSGHWASNRNFIEHHDDKLRLA